MGRRGALVSYTESVPSEEPAMSDRSRQQSGESSNGVSRRSFIKTMGVSAAAASVGAAVEARAKAVAGDAETAIQGPAPVDITLNVNGKPSKLKVEPSTTLLQALRIDLGLTGSK